MKNWLQLSNVRVFWGYIWGLGVAFEWDDWYAPADRTRRHALTFKFYLIGFMITGNLYVGKPVL